MLGRVGVFVVVIALCATVCACSHQLYSPPVRSLPLDTPAVLDGARAAAGLGVAHYFEVWGPDIMTESAFGRLGLGHGLEATLDLRLAQVFGASSANTDRSIGSGRLGLKWTPPYVRPYFAFTGGAGGGYSAAGGFVGGDVGFVLGYENRYVVPFFAFQAHFSRPVHARAVDTSEADTIPGTSVDRPRFTWAREITAGWKVNFHPRRRQHSASVTVGCSFLTLYSSEGSGKSVSETFLAGGLALMVPL